MPPHKQLAYTLLRITLGVNFCGHGLFRILSGTSAFAHTMTEHMTKSPLPVGLMTAFGFCIPFIELLLGAALIVGLLTRVTLVGGALFLMALTVGVTSNQQWDVAGQQLLYSLIVFVLLFCVEHNGVALDTLIARRRSIQ